MKSVSFALVLCSSLVTCRDCPSPFSPHGKGCYFLSETFGNISDCQNTICANSRGTLASIDSKSLNDFLSSKLHEAQSAFIGLFEQGEDESGEWVWADGSQWNLTLWAVGEPNNWCLDEDCAVLGHSEVGGIADSFGAWYDVSCTERRQCFCQLGGIVSLDFRNKEANMTNKSEEGSYEQCLAKAEKCSWYESGFFQFLFVFVGLPCAIIGMYSLGATAFIGLGFGKRDHNAGTDQIGIIQSLYGGLLNNSSSVSTSVDDLVDRWIVRGAWSSIFYAIGLFLLAFTTWLHMNRGISFGFGIDTLGAFVMFICKFVVALSAGLVHWYLSPLSRIVASWWVLFLAVSKFAAALCTLILASGYFGAALTGGTGSLCTWGYSLCWTLITSFLCESLAALSLCRLQQRAVVHAGDPRVFSHVIGCSWLLLVAGTLGAGFDLGIAAVLFIFGETIYGESDHFRTARELGDIGTFYFCAAVSQFLAGIAMLRANGQIRRYFANFTEALDSEEGFDTQAGVEMVSS